MLTRQPPRYPPEELRRGFDGIVRARVHAATADIVVPIEFRAR